MDAFFRIICPPVEFKPEVTMKKFLLICAALTAFAVPAHAQLFTAWGACDGTAGSSTGNMNFDCTPGSGFSAQIFGTFGVSSPIPNFVAAEGIVDFAFQGASDVPAFWHFEAGGCNSTGIGYSLARGSSTLQCATTNSTIFCGTTGVACTGGISNYINNYGAANRSRLFFANARSALSPVTLPAVPTRVFCFFITFLTDNTPGSGGAECAGCETPTAIAWNQLSLFDNQPATGPEARFELSSATPGSTGNMATNGATISVSTTKKTWGQLKSLYR